MRGQKRDVEVSRWRDDIAGRFDRRPESLIPALQHVQRAAGYLPPQAITAVAQHLRVPEAKVFGVATFYSLFHLQPRGRTQITVCRGTACHVRGSSRLLTDLEKLLGVRAGGTTGDMRFSLETVACLGSCALAPVVVKDKVYGRQTSTSVRALVEDAPTRPAARTGRTKRAAQAKPASAKRTNARIPH